jgi:CubicO group peptidase (beta-lactamase class C family)
MVVRLGAAALVLALVAAACSSDDDAKGAEGNDVPTEEASADQASVYPTAEWERADAGEMGFDQAKLDALAAEAESQDSNCLIVTRHGKLVADWYWNGTDASSSQEVFSATKSYSSTLVGIAQDEGKLDIDDKASKYINEWVGTPSENITVRNLLSNDSGRHWDFQSDYISLSGSPDRDAFAIGLPQDAPPGETWVYNNAAIQTLDAVLHRSTGQPTADYAKQKLLDPIGMTESAFSVDGAGNAATYFGLSSTCEDMARFGYLFLRDGNWDGTQVVSEDWVKQATRSSQDINPGYGFLWWLNVPGHEIGVTAAVTKEQADANPERDRPAGASEDMYWAQGLGGQVIQVDPGSDTVAVRLGTGDVGAKYGSFDTAKIVTEALTDQPRYRQPDAGPVDDS